ncbi:MAG: DUF4093 domain-containing protein [Clostridia bacterium]|nr:DUF4093 domain-containing protein [Clostridia bacterium]
MDRLHITLPVFVEGRYDKVHLQNITDAVIISLDGFGIFNSAEKRKLIRKIAAESRVIVLTDSDGAGLLIRNHLRNIISADKIINLYVPEIKGKEKRKNAPSKQGLLGVEGIDPEIIRKLLLPFAQNGEVKKKSRQVTKTDFFEDGLSGGTGSSEKRKKAAQKMDLPANISANALLEAVNLLYSYEEYKEIINGINTEG